MLESFGVDDRGQFSSWSCRCRQAFAIPQSFALARPGLDKLVPYMPFASDPHWPTQSIGHRCLGIDP